MHYWFSFLNHANQLQLIMIIINQYFLIIFKERESVVLEKFNVHEKVG
jgi:hypothetical protein